MTPKNMARYTPEINVPAVVAMMPGGREAIAAYAIMPFVDEGAEISAKFLSEAISRLFRQGKSRSAKRAMAPLYDRVESALGQRPEVCHTRITDMLREIERHQWIEAEKANRDIWVEADPKDPFGAAVRDWYVKHYADWSGYIGAGGTAK